jgi:hypothetical protein
MRKFYSPLYSNFAHLRAPVAYGSQAKGNPMQRAQIPSRPEIKMHRISGACENSGLSRSTLYNRINDGSLHTVKVHGCRLIPDAALRKLLKMEPTDT